MGYKYFFNQGGEYAEEPMYRTEWLPSLIVCPSGRKVEFRYKAWTSPLRNYGHKDAPVYGFRPNSTLISPSNPRNLCPSYDGGLLLTSVKFGKEVVSLTYKTVNNTGRLLESLTVAFNNQQVKKFSFGFDALLGVMTSVASPEGNYTFAYNTDAAKVNTCPDWWGFYNGEEYPWRVYGDSPSVKYSDLIQIAPNYAPQNFQHRGINRNPNEKAMQWRMLTKATYPTGGQTEWEYEAHRFDGSRVYSDLTFGGGVRVKSITHKENPDDANPQKLTYEYSLADYPALPTLETFLDTYEAVDLCKYGQGEILTPDDGTTFFRGTQCLVIGDRSNYMQYRFEQIPMWYPWVIEYAAEGKTTYTFEDLIYEAPHTLAGPFNYCPEKINHAFSSGPQQVSRRVYKLQGNNYKLALCDSMEYVTKSSTKPSINSGGHIIKRKRHCSNQAAYILHIGDTINTAPDFTDKLSLPFYFRIANRADNQWTTSSFSGQFDSNGKEIFYVLKIPEDFAYYQRHFDISPTRECLSKKITTDYRANGNYIVETEYSYLQNSGLIASETKRVKNSSITTSYTYASESSTDSVAQKMVRDKHIVGRPIAQSLTFGNKTISTKEILQDTVFLPKCIETNRGAGAFSSPSYKWWLNGKLDSVTDSASIATNYSWDTDTLYPIGMSKGTLHYSATWQPGVGVTSLTSPDGVKQYFKYDTANRLSETGIENKGITKMWTYNIGGNSDNYIIEKLSNDRYGFLSSDTRSNFDGLGRMVSVVKHYQDRLDNVRFASAIDYDQMGRKYRETMLAPVSSDNPTFADVLSSAESYYNDSKPYALSEYELSQRALPTGTITAGETWHSNNRKKTVRLLVNSKYSDYGCRRLSVDSSDSIVDNGLYEVGALSVECIQDEDGVAECTFTDIRGKCVLKTHGSYKTYFVYDDLGDLRYILPPNLSPKGYASDNKDIVASAYVFRYDGRGRLIYAKVPGCAASEYIYDSADRLVAETNGDLNGKWRLHFYDSCAREALVVETSLEGVSKSRLVQARSVMYSSSSRSNFVRCGYLMPVSLPQTAKVRYANYYDDYSQFGDTVLPNYNATPKGRLTGNLSIDDRGDTTRVSYYYDKFGQQILSIAKSAYSTTKEQLTYTYSGQVKSRTETFTPHNKTYCREKILVHNYTYDDNNRPVKESITLNGLAKASTDIAYDGVGRIASQSIKSAESDAPTLKRSFAYDVHGWLSSITTSLPLELRSIQRSNVATNFYSAASLLPIEVPLLTMDYTESIYYATGTNPKYNGTPSARSLTLGGRYDYSYDYNDRLVKALYTAPTGSSADFSTEYKYDVLSRPTEVKRYGVVDNNGRTETFGVLDHFTIDYNGARPYKINSKTGDIDGRSFLGRTGWSNGLYKSSATQQYNAAGRITYDDSRSLSSVRYNTYGLPVSMVMMTLADTTRYKEREYDVRGIKTRQTEWINNGVASSQKIADRRYIGSFILNCDTLERVNFGAGYLDSKGKPHFLFTDWQGNVTMTTDSRGHIEQHIGYYPYGEPWREPAGQRLSLYGGKERQSGVLAGDYDFGPRSLTFTTLFTAPDRAAICYPHLSSYAYCAANPIRYIDPTGNKIVGLTEEDARLLVQDLQAMFPSEEFSDFRPLIRRKGKELRPISESDLNKAFDGKTLNADQQQLVNMVTNTINSKDVHKVEYIDRNGSVSPQAKKILERELDKKFISEIYSHLGSSQRLPSWVAESKGKDGLTMLNNKGTHTLIFKNPIYIPYPRAVVTGHEIFGHGRSLSLGRGDAMQHIDAVQTENLIRRIMGITEMFDGVGHFNPTGEAVPLEILIQIPNFK